MESANLLQIPGRPVARPGEKATNPGIEEPPEVIQALIDSDRANWTQYAHGLYDAGLFMLKEYRWVNSLKGTKPKFRELAQTF
ncbi:MAG: hypothetical protein M3N41_11570 [Acidobacteriota bacterium]|nr:hypothetical protein [Acidobacteriota bacterium]